MEKYFQIKWFPLKLLGRGQGYRSRRQAVEQRFFVMTFPSLEGWLVVAEGGRTVRDVMWKEGSVW